MKQAHCLIVLLRALTLSACGGGGGGGGSGGSGGGGGGGGGTGASYTIGGSAQGVATYSSSGMVLQDNSGNDLSVTSDGPFTFSQPVSGAYKVTVATQPTGETCTVTNGSGTATGNVSDVSISCVSSLVNGSNVASVSVGTFPSDVTQQVFNVPIVTVKVCGTPSTNCQNIQVLVDTGSSGLRLMSSAAVTALNLAPETSGTGTLSECAYYADGYAWGGVYTATQVSIADETASNVPVQVINTSTPPTNCTSNSPGGTTDLDSPDSFSADGVLGIGPAPQDCGSLCTTNSALYYYSCPVSGTCTGATASLATQVTNPVTMFTSTKDNNGTLLQLPAISASGVASATGYLAFGIGTQTDNGIGNATILSLSGTQPQDQQPMYLTTSFNGTNNIDGIIDSGSNAYFFADSQIPQCTTYAPFYCPSTTQSLSATNTGGSSPSTVSFQVADFNTLAASMFYAYNDVGGAAPTVNGTTYFDWGLPFFYGRTVYTLIDGATVGGQTYANGAFAY